MAKERGPPHRYSTRPASNTYRPKPSGTDKYRPKWAPRDNGSRPDHPRSYESYRPGDDGVRERREKPRQEDVPSLPPVRSAVTKTRHERATNPSTRIHSLKNQLQKQELPGTIRQEKERELAALLFEQEQNKLKQEARKNLQRYHFIRFVERQKSERNLKKLVRQRDSCNDENARKELEKQIHITEVDLNYAKYAPLGDKYISLFPNDHTDNKDKRKRAKFQMNRLDFAILDEEQQRELRSQYEQAANVVRTAAGDKPPMWYQIEERMEKGEAQLDLLREGKLTTGKQLKTSLATLGGKEDARMRSTNGPDLTEAKPDWLDHDGVIDPADLDSDQDEDMSDGGFFER
ncbi:hypothetical protein A1O7_00754 [Cladophialophora yegresii CBS 114405]|uniref:rRNA-processing protein EFG1 n=1 Tax=Cladophialophora yegresii CBS 114405 TaxID=1182544 RepID=W9W908_9EURO|nr:uncharacterized protein A1O7_00754 [Cladophialophora yegresii CBS 114405]EXJ64418.1 hypothetical protein A1O7_00754 [Cladophialophora yegresii CBS 114405]